MNLQIFKRQSQTFKNLAFVLSGSFGAQIISFLFYPLLVRIFTPEDFGNFGTYSSLIVVSAIFASGQLHFAFIKTRDDFSELNWLFRRYALLGTFIISLIIAVSNFYFNFIPSYFLYFFPIGLLSYIYFESQKMYSVKIESFKVLSHAVNGNRLSSNILKVLFGKFFSHPLALIFSEIIGNFLSSIYFKKYISMPSSKPVKVRDIISRYRQFPLFTTFSTFFTLGLTELPVIVLATYYPKNEIGVYVLAVRLILQPLNIIGNSIGSVVSKRIINNHYGQTSSRRILTKIYGLYIAIGILSFATTYIVPKEWFLFLLGKNWENFKEVLLPITLLITAKMSSGLHIYFYVANEEMKIKSIFKGAQLAITFIIITTFSNLPLTELLWLMCSIEAALDLIFTIYTVFSSDKFSMTPKNSQVGKK
ncbi:MAG: lipopolysaccharide biosynthesis protein [Bacteriovoracaceae bacterium]